MTTSFWQADNTQPIRHVDLLIVGAGLIGCASAYMAHEMGHDVVITEKADVALGASGRNAGFMITGLDTYYHRAIETYGSDVAHEMWDISIKSIDFWKQMVTQSEGAVQYAQSGSLLLAESDAEAQELHTAYEALRADGYTHLRFHGDDPLHRGYAAAIENPHDAAVQPYQLTQSILKQSHAEIISNNELYALEQTDDDSVIVYTRQFRFKANYVLLCTNAYSPQIDPYFVGKVIPNRAQVLVTEPLPHPILSSCGYSDYGYMYYRMTFDHRLLIGGARNHHFETENNTTEDIVSHPVQASLEAYMSKHFPDITAKVERRWGGIMGFSVDGLPLVGTLPHQSRIGFAVGFTGHGISMGAETARRALIKLFTGQHAGAVDVDRL